MVVSLVVTAFWAMVPAYVPNNAAVLGGGGRPIDGGRTLGDTRLLGDGKTWRGTLVGTAAGIAMAFVLNALAEPAGAALGVTLPVFTPAAAGALAAGAMAGDIGASFLKRRSGRKRGAAFPGLDQLDFVVGAVGVVFAVTPAWATAVFSLPVLIAVVVMTPVFHVVTNVFAYAVGLKNEPW